MARLKLLQLWRLKWAGDLARFIQHDKDAVKMVLLVLSCYAFQNLIACSWINEVCQALLHQLLRDKDDIIQDVLIIYLVIDHHSI